MKRIAIFCVNYNSYRELTGYFQSLLSAVSKANAGQEAVVSLDVFVADNTEENSQEISLGDTGALPITCRIFPFHRNLGYFGAVGEMMKEVDVSVYDYVLISNVDLTVADDFFVKLSDYPCDATTGEIAPQIYSQGEMRDKNPKILHRYGLRKLKILKLLYHYPILETLYTRTFYRRKKYHQPHPAGQIYAGHGSLVILTKKYFELCGKIDYPVFLFCEEIYLAEQCLKAGLSVEYVPDIKVMDAEHVSTGCMRHGFYCRCNYEAMRYIIDRFYKMPDY